MVKRVCLLAAAHLSALAGLTYVTGSFAGRNGTISFLGHLALTVLFVCAGIISISGKIDTPRLVRMEAYLGLAGAFVYILVDTFIIHPPLGIFDGAGMAEQQHVSLFLMLVGLASFVLITLRYTEELPSVQILIAAAAFAIVFSAHEQHTATSVMGHNATTAFVLLAAVLRLLDRTFEYGVVLFIAAHTFFGSQTGLAQFGESVGIAPASWSAYWITAGSLVAAAYLVAIKGKPTARPQPTSSTGL